jgi:hypothetical protein
MNTSNRFHFDEFSDDLEMSDASLLSNRFVVADLDWLLLSDGPNLGCVGEYEDDESFD